MALICHRCCKNKNITAILDIQALAQIGYRQWEIPYGNVSFRNACQGLFHFPFIHGSQPLDNKAPAWEIRNLPVSHKQMAIVIKLCQLIPFGDLPKTARLHQRGIRLIQETRVRNTRTDKSLFCLTRLIIKHFLVVDTIDMKGLLILCNDQEQFLALVCHRQDMDFVHKDRAHLSRLKILNSFPPIEHRRQL